MKKLLLNLTFLVVFAGCSKKEGKIFCVMQGEQRDPTKFSWTHSSRASAYVDKYWMGNAYSWKDTMYITLVDENTLKVDSSSYRNNILDTASYNIFLYAFEKDRGDSANWERLHFNFEIMFASYPKTDTVLYFHYPLKLYKYPPK